MINIFEEIVQEVEEEYGKSENNLGWRFLTVSKKSLLKNSGTFLITLNPGGTKEDPKHGKGSCENGCAYLTEIWKKDCCPGQSILQRQIQSLFQRIANNSKYGRGNYTELMENSVCGYFIPFRSPDLKSLKEKNETLDLGKRIWKKVFINSNVQLVICIDTITFLKVREILAELNCLEIRSSDYDVRWGTYKSTVVKYIRNNQVLTLVRFPHLSRFTIFGREASASYIDIIFNEIFKTH
jgi:hypothetical protein